MCEREDVVDDNRRRAAVGHVIDEARNRDQGLGLWFEILASGERRQPAQPPGAARQLCDRVAHRNRITTLEPVGNDQHRSTPRVSGKPRHGEKRLQGVPYAGAAVPIADRLRRRAQ